MKIHIYKKEEGRKFYITFNDVTSNGQGYGGSISLDIDDFKSLGEKINTELENLNKSSSSDESSYKNISLKWTDIWRAPFRYDHYGYIWDSNNVMTFTINDLTEENDQWIQEFCDNMVKALNDEECKQYPGLNVKDGCDLYKGEELIGFFGGWGHLTGGLKMSSEEAAAIQDEMIEFVMSKMAR